MIYFWIADVLVCFAVCVIEFEVLFWFTLFGWSHGKRGTRKVCLHHVENSSKKVNDILETFLPDGNFDTIVRLNTLKTSILNKIEKIRGLDEQLLSQLHEKDLENELNQIFIGEDELLLMNTNMLSL